MKKRLAASFITVMASSLLLIGCGGQPTAKEPSPATPASPQASAPAPETPAATQQPQGAKVVDSMVLTLGGASPGGFWSLIGEGIGNIIREAVPNTQFSYVTGNGVSNTIQAANGTIELGLAHNFEVKAGLEGAEPFKEKLPAVTAIATMYNNAPQQFIMTQEFADKYGITSLADIAEKKPPIKVAVNQRGNLTEAINRYAFEANGFNYENIKSWGGEVYYEPYKPAADMMKDNKVDLFGVPVFAPDGKMLELLTAKKLVMLPIDEKAQQLLHEKLGIPAGVIPANSYEFQKEDVATSNASAILTVDPNLSIDEAYTITKTLVENLDKIKALHKDLKILTPEIMANVAPANLHPGAELYYKEAGIIK
ncbi:TAXI family TRAP transporter solute-binding subunit [Ammoniphilus sp. YIM 78166]|uniref:TAXI family TRAP transporter solute-binding subunit n=1 Tax=Ammoniphilus sp. YIM 78166 TaxID=1644106 RepID=UPI00106FDADC|nr:TAXI family TRAP transporter solute-binding subunit [Ammoniphilus sp. YIM 78166]